MTQEKRKIEVLWGAGNTPQRSQPMVEVDMGPLSFIDRFWSRVDRSGSCWVWTGSRDPGGYGKVRYQGRIVGTHRVAYRLAHGDIPAGLEVCHTCDNPPCCNPAHLFLGTHDENVADRLCASGVRAGHHQRRRTRVRRLLRWPVCLEARRPQTIRVPDPDARCVGSVDLHSGS